MSGEEFDSDMDCSDSDCGDPGYEDYYSVQPWGGNLDNDGDYDQILRDPEFAVFECLRVEEVERLLNESVEILSTNLSITPSLAKLLLHAHEWAVQDIVSKYNNKAFSVIIDSKICFTQTDKSEKVKFQKENYCSVCFITSSTDKFSTLTCGHFFCKDCWCTHFETQLLQGVSTGEH